MLTHPSPKVPFSPTGILGEGGPGSIPSVLGLEKPVFKLMGKALGRNTHARSVNIDYAKYLDVLPRAQPATVSTKHVFLSYVRQYWSEHTRALVPLNWRQSHKTVVALERLVKDKTSTFEFRPLGPNRHLGSYGCKSCSECDSTAKDLPLTSMFHWAAQFGHQVLMIFISDGYVVHERDNNEVLLIACKHRQSDIVSALLPRLIPIALHQQ